MRRNLGIVLILIGVALGIWGFMRHEEKEPDIKIGDVEIVGHKEKDYPTGTLVIAGVVLLAGVVVASGKR